MNFLSGLAQKRGTILFVGTKRSAREPSRKKPAVVASLSWRQRWLGGMLTNFRTVKGRSAASRNWKPARPTARSPSWSSTKCCSCSASARSWKSLGGIKNMNGLPDALFVIDIGHENIAMLEAKKLGIPVVAVVDTNYDPAWSTTPSPATTTPSAPCSCTPAPPLTPCSKARLPRRSLLAVDDEFVELDAEGNPIAKDDGERKKAAPRGRAPAKKGPAAPRGRAPRGKSADGAE
jgi:small subunit ribosomal protein S2